jgi:hypothetical protein
MPFHLIGGLLHQATAQGSRSTVLRPLGWLASICGALLVAVIGAKSPTWVVAVFVVAVAATVILYMAAYIYCLLTDKDALRSETFSIQKLAIEKGIVGDSVAGISQLNDQIMTTPIDAPPIRAALGERNR